MNKKTYMFTLAVFFTLCSAVAGPLWGHTQPEAGFCTLERNNFYFHSDSYFNRVALQTSEARIWYVYQPADEDPGSKPLFVFFNGGPGGATSSGLLSCFTGRKAVIKNFNTGTASVTDNPHSWTRLGNLLHIDARTTGFSYSLMDNPQYDILRKGEFDAQNYNCFIDGADFVRVLLRFLSEHPQLQQNRVIIVAESYGGIRSTVMLHLLHYYTIYGNGQATYQDPSLVQDIQTHYETVFLQYQNQIVPRHIIAQQFGHQILIQPAISRDYQRQVAAEMLEAPGSPLYQLAAETGIPYIRWRDQAGNTGTPTANQIMDNVYAFLERINRDPYICSRPDGFLTGYFGSAAELLTEYNSLNQIIGVDAAGIPELFASSRQQAYKTIDSDNTALRIYLSNQIEPPMKDRCFYNLFFPSSEENLSTIFGNLEPWDRFFIDLNYDANMAFTLNRTTFYGYLLRFALTPLYGRMFLENVAIVDTFVTNADYDIVVFTPALPDALALHTDMLHSSTHDTAGPPGTERPGQIILDYKANSVPGIDTAMRTIRFPRYTKSGHAVTLTEPGEILADVENWLRTTGLSTPSQGEVK